jgi:hypothetical protein
MLSTSIRNKATIFLAGMLLLHVTVMWQEWWAIPIGFPDFSIFYTAGKILQAGDGPRLYTNDLQVPIQQSFAAQGVAKRGSILPFNHPPFEALLLVPFAALTYMQAYWAWFVLNLALMAVVCGVLRRTLPNLARVPFWLWFLAALGFLPNFFSLMQGQDSLIVLLVYTLAFAAWNRRSEFLCGAWLGFGLCKYHLILPFMVAFAIRRRWRVIAGFLVVAAVLATISLAVVGWDGLRQYPSFVWWWEHTSTFSWTLHHQNTPNLRGMISSVLPGNGESLASKVALVFASLSLLAIADSLWPATEHATPAYRQMAFALNLLMTLLVSYHSYVQDLSLLFLSMLLVLDVLLAPSTVSTTQRKALLTCMAILCCSPVYLVLILIFGKMWMLTLVLLAFFGALVSALRSSTVPLAGTA